MTKDSKYVSKEAPFKNYRSARIYFLKEFGFERKFRLQSKLHLGNMDKFQKELKAKHSLEELDELKIDMEGTVEQMKLVAPLVAILTFASTLFGVSYTVFIDNQKDLRSKLAIIEEEYKQAVLPISSSSNVTPKKILHAAHEKISKEITDIQYMYSISILTALELVLIGIAIVYIGMRYYRTIKENILLFRSVSKAYDEKKEEEESRYRVKLSK